jgi:hypothetical protein
MPIRKNFLQGFISELKLADGEKVKSKARQLIEIFQLLVRCQFTPDEYYYNRFYESGKDYKYMLNYLSNYHSLVNFHPILLDQSWIHILRNKVIFNYYYRSFNLPVTNFFGFYHPHSGVSSDGFLLTKKEELKHYLQGKKPDSLVIKPVCGGRGKKVMVIDEIDYRDDSLIFRSSDGKIICFNELVEKMEEISLKKSYSGCLLEEKVFQIEVLNQINPASINTVRVATFLNKNSRADIHLAVFRLGRAHSCVDNISRGGLVIGVNIIDGTLGEGVCYTKYGRGRYSEHPDTGVKFTGLKLPYWKEITDLCKKAARVSPFCRSIGWDIAVTQDGPVLLEGNDHWFVNQAHIDGYLQPDVRVSLAEFGLFFPEGKLPPINYKDIFGALKRWSKL